MKTMVHQHQQTVRPQPDSPVGHLNRILPHGIPVEAGIICIQGQDCYAVPLPVAMEEGLCRAIGTAMVQAGLGQLFSYALSRYKLCPLPVEWTE